MANEVTITVTGRDRTGGLFSGVAKRANTAFGAVRQAVKAQMTAAASDAEAGGRTVGEKLVSGAARAVSGQSGTLTAGLTAGMPAAGETAGAAFGDGFTRAADRRLSAAKGGFMKAIVPGGEVEREGRSVGSRLMSAIGGAIATGAGAVVSTMAESFKALGPIAKPILIAALVGAATVAGITAGAALGGALVLGLGTGFVGIGALVLLENEKIKKEFEKTGEEIKKIMAEASKPLLPVFRDAMNGVKELVQEFKPVFSDVFKDSEVQLKRFTSEFIGAFRELKPAVEPLMDSFTGLLGVIGPQLKTLFKDIAASLQDLSGTVSANQTMIGSLFVLIAKAIPTTITALARLVDAFNWAISVTNTLQAAMRTTFHNAQLAGLEFAEKLLGVLRVVGQAISNIPGMEGLSQRLVAGIDTAIGKVKEWKIETEKAKWKVNLEANIFDLTQKIDAARAQLNDPNLTKERRAKLTAEIAELIERKQSALVALGDKKLVAEYRANLTANISTLESRLATARKELADPNLTKERKAKLNADISDLESRVAAAKRALNSLQDKTVRVTTIYSSVQGQQAALAKASKYAHGGVIGAAGGGPRSNMTLVGEQGPELVRLPFGSTVVPAGQTRNMLSAAGDQGGGLTVNLYVQGSIHSDRDIVRIIRDEFNNGGFRGALSNA